MSFASGLPGDKLPEVLDHASLQLSFSYPVHLGAVQRGLKPFVQTSDQQFKPTYLPVQVSRCDAGEPLTFGSGPWGRPVFGRSAPDTSPLMQVSIGCVAFLSRILGDQLHLLLDVSSH